MRTMQIVTAIALSAVPVSEAYSFGPHGHETVGAIADQLLKGKPVAEEIRKLLDGLTLAEAALLPDKIKEWDNQPPNRAATFHIADHPSIEQQLRAFWEANPPIHNNADTKPSHHWFHYTDVPVVGGNKYSQGFTGRSKWDIVHMIPFCIRVVTGEASAQNERKITRPVAIILLAHFVGDVHQPLHVGAEYFSAIGKPVNPDSGKIGFPDDGGNGLTLDLYEASDRRRGHKNVNLHGYWDNDAVVTALQLAREEVIAEHPRKSGKVQRGELITYFATHEPLKWTSPLRKNPTDWAEQWADEILPIATEAHGRLRFGNFSIDYSHGKAVATGTVHPKPRPDHTTYEDWSGRVVKNQIHKAGWRLATLLEQIVR